MFGIICPYIVSSHRCVWNPVDVGGFVVVVFFFSQRWTVVCIYLWCRQCAVRIMWQAVIMWTAAHTLKPDNRSVSVKFQFKTTFIEHFQHSRLPNWMHLVGDILPRFINGMHFSLLNLTKKTKKQQQLIVP